MHFEIKYHDQDGVHYKHPERSCERCLNYPCLENQCKLKGNFAAYGCLDYSDVNTFVIHKTKDKK